MLSRPGDPRSAALGDLPGVCEEAIILPDGTREYRICTWQRKELLNHLPALASDGAEPWCCGFWGTAVMEFGRSGEVTTERM